MPIMFNMLLREAGLNLKEVRLLRHKDKGASKGKTPFDLWLNYRDKFELYQSTQKIKNRKKFAAPYWASFVGLHTGETMFVGLYGVKYLGLLKVDQQRPHMDGVDEAGRYDKYKLTVQDGFADFHGKLFIDWGGGERAWVQHAALHDKPVIELRKEFKEEPFPGFINFEKSLSELDRLPESWIEFLQNARGIYLLTCPRTKEQYVGSANGEEGFWQRFQEYIRSGHGGNVALKSRDPSDYRVSILEVVGSSITLESDVRKIEDLWQRKLQSNEMGLNRQSRLNRA